MCPSQPLYAWCVSPAPSKLPSVGARALPRIGITLGDPGGIGPEVIVKALADESLRSSAHFVILGPQWPLLHAAGLAGIRPYWTISTDASACAKSMAAGPSCIVLDESPASDPLFGPSSRWPTSANARAGEVSFALVERAIALAQAGELDAIVTGPINKHAWSLAGHTRYPGHTELFAERFHSDDDRWGMMFHAPRINESGHALNVILATAHMPLMKVGPSLSIGRVLDAIVLGQRACIDLGVESPRVAVCGLNPHAGEAGLLGTEDDAIITPAIEAAREQGIDCAGPFPGDTIFTAAVRGDYDLVVAMYHDQGLIPVKLLARDRAVNMTVGLPVVRTSPDHGTAFDIAGKNVADPGSMKAAIALALRALQ
jgi:4-hydroxythreonine-4-phosphate dehydrogenase